MVDLGDGNMPPADANPGEQQTFFAGNGIGLDFDQDTSPLYDAEGYAGYTATLSDGNTITRGRGDRYNAEQGGDAGVIGWARLAGGSGIVTQDRGEQGGDHYVWGVNAIDIPTAGLFEYELIGTTAPTMRGAQVDPGSFDGRMSLDFNGTLLFMGLEASVAIDGFTYAIASEGGVAAPSIEQSGAMGRLGGTIDLPDGQGSACNQGDCRFQFPGMLAGEGASHAGFAYTIRDDRSNDVRNWIDGSAVFRKGDPISGGAVFVDKSYGGVTIDAAFAQPADGDFGAGFYAGARIQDRGGPSNEIVERVTDFEGLGTGNATQVTEVKLRGGVGPEYRQIGTAGNADNGALGDVIGWTRWTDGEAVSGDGSTLTLTGSQSIHYLYGDVPTLNTFPAIGRAEYVLAGGPTRRDMWRPGQHQELVVDLHLMVGWDTIVAIPATGSISAKAASRPAPPGGQHPYRHPARLRQRRPLSRRALQAAPAAAGFRPGGDGHAGHLCNRSTSGPSMGPPCSREWRRTTRSPAAASSQ